MAITAVGESQTFSYAGAVEEFVVPFSGLYQLEVKGAKGGNCNNSVGGNGGYSKGYIFLKKGEKLYIVCGGSGITPTSASRPSGGYNGGGRGGGKVDNKLYYAGGSGGGATHIARTTNRGTLENYASYQSEILIVAGGGGGAGGTNTYSVAHGGPGGGLSGSAGVGSEKWGGTGCGTGGTQTAGGKYTGDPSTGSTGAFGQGGHGGYVGQHYTSYSGGGGGWYGGGAGGEWNGANGAGGGSGYIGGVPEIVHKDITYTPSTTNGTNSGNGTATITFIAKKASFGFLGDKEIVGMRLGDKEVTGWKVG